MTVFSALFAKMSIKMLKQEKI